eukprot:gene21265-28185_t
MGNEASQGADGWDRFPDVEEPYTPKTSGVYQDMTLPLSSYYISSGHNSYLSGDQVASVSNTKTIEKCLKLELIELRTDEMDSVVADDNVVAEYQARQRRITSKEQERRITAKEQELAELEIQREAILSGIEAKKALWLPEMRKLVHTINISFETNFKDIGCAGEVSLKEDEDYDKCAIEIKVTFREGEEMHLLTSKRQSGGERSVATILYLIALQGVTDTPFRVVDEINQGMDAANERKVFELLVQSSCKPDTPQCFLLTPKLLAGLTFNRDITVLIIMNGPHLEEGLPKAFNKKKMLRQAGHSGATGPT